ncbi:putative electron transfer flavoprotein subunit beta [Besnoitia besnoiti]|uniref:Electron transfer flavoprotein subunit beta n=1 Tax=Besnoitia besnoiti TaxID=94643 RepID=A0A2A9MBR9_BESBE|nr:putative electron transfer flavoprotein subunit beta [Besnoitia besnoiti]PFH33356.1 putative electron transfer flavoprotein subunit beta [Besnoitia besnoiti]
MKGILGTAVVCVKRTLDFAIKPQLDPGRKAMRTEGLKHSINPFCEIAVEEAVRLKEQGLVQRIVAVSVGGPGAPQPQQDVLRHALAMGADEAVLIQSPFKPDLHLQTLPTAKILRSFVKSRRGQLVLLGKQSTDGDNQQVPQLLAGLLGWPQATCLFKLEVSAVPDRLLEALEGNERLPEEEKQRRLEKHRAKVLLATREIDGGLQTVRLAPPAVLSCDLRLNTPRFVTLPNLMKAKKKPIPVLDASKLVSESDLKPRLEILRVEEPPRRAPGRRVANVDELIERLITEAKVIHS